MTLVGQLLIRFLTLDGLLVGAIPLRLRREQNKQMVSYIRIYGIGLYGYQQFWCVSMHAFHSSFVSLTQKHMEKVQYFCVNTRFLCMTKSTKSLFCVFLFLVAEANR